MRRCSVCGETKPLEQFAYKNKRTGARQPKCRDCHNAYNRWWYSRNTVVHRTNTARISAQFREGEHRYLHSLRVPCLYCGEPDKRCLIFHHRDPSTKSGDVTRMAGRVSRKRLDAEIAKCDVICANCHAKQHWPRHLTEKVVG